MAFSLSVFAVIMFPHYLHSLANGTLPEFASLCPYNTMCKSKAVKTINDSRLTSCCQKCSCAEDCYLVGNCCPDVEPVNISIPKYPCIDITQLFNAERGLKFWPRYRIWFSVINTCPSHELEEQFPGCYSSKDIRDFVIVSDLSGEKVYKNRQCAWCHGVTQYEEWNTLISDPKMATLTFQSFEERDRYIMENSAILSLPPNISFVESAMCFGRNILYTCRNESAPDELKNACMKKWPLHNTLFFENRSGGFRNIYSNIYCYLCSKLEDDVIKDQCPIGDKIRFKLLGSSFTALVNLKEADSKMETNSKCGLTEIWDPFESTCRRLRCQWGTIPFYGNCQTILSNTVGYTIAIMFHVNITGVDWSLSSYKMFYFVAGYLRTLRPKQFSCRDCIQEVYAANDTTYYIFRWTIKTNDYCRAKNALSFANKLRKMGIIRLAYNHTQTPVNISLKMTFKNQRNIQSTPVFRYARAICPSPVEIDAIICSNCPRIELSTEETICLTKNLVDNDEREHFLNLFIIDESTNQISICVSDYTRIRNNLKGGQDTSLRNASLWLCISVIYVFAIWFGL